MPSPWRQRSWWAERRGRLRRWQIALLVAALAVALGAIVASVGDDPTPLDVVGEMQREGEAAPDDPAQALPPPTPWAAEEVDNLAVVEAPRPDIDYTDRQAISRLAGTWEFESGGVARFGGEVGEEVDHGGARITVFPVEARGLPSRYTIVRVPGGGNFLAFWDDGYEVVWENVVFHDRDLVSYSPLDSGRRRYAYRAGTRRFRRAPPPPFAGGAAPPLAELDPAIDPDGPPPASGVPGTVADLPGLWERAETLRRAGRFHSLDDVLGQILGIDPGDRRAREWRAGIRDEMRQQERAVGDALRDRLRELASAVSDEDLRDVLGLWAGGADPATRRYFEELFRRRGEPRVGIELQTIQIEDGVAHFTADVSIVYPRDRRLADNHRWRATFHGGRFSGPFPG